MVENISKEEAWIESASVRQIAEKVIGTQTIVILWLIFLFAFLYSYTTLLTWASWLTLHTLVTLKRIQIKNGYQRLENNNLISDQTAYYFQHSYVAVIVGLLWGATGYLFYGPIPSTISSVYFYGVLAYGFGATINLSTHLKSLKFFLFSYGFGLIGATVATMAIDPQVNVDITHSTIIFGIMLLAVLMYKIGKRLNITHTNALRHEYRNQRLIASLTLEKQIAIDAVASKNRMLASAAHDMRQPVLALDIYAGWLVDEPTSSLEIAPKIVASTKAVIDLFDSMFDMSRLSEGQISTRLEAVNLGELISELFVQYQPLAKSKNLSLRTHTIDSTVFTDYILLTRILGNLISNAIKYTQTGGVLIACRNTAQGVNVEVWDTGVGIDSDQHALVFKEFYKSPSNLGTSDGFGLGLAIVTQLADLIGAGLTLRSRRGRGTVVSIKLGKMI